MPQADLITLNEYKLINGVNPTNTKNDPLIAALIPAVSRSVRSFTDRKFDVAGDPSPRKFHWDGSEFLDIDDCTEVTKVTWNNGYVGSEDIVMDPAEYTAMPYRETEDDDPHYYIVFEGAPGVVSPAMGFTRNLDTKPIGDLPATVTITARWGWQEIPADVKWAVAWTILDAVNKPSTSDLQSESIAGYSRSYAATAAGMAMAIPARARDLLVAYQRPF